MNKRILLLAAVSILIASMAVGTVNACITLTPGYWKNHPNAWLADSLEIGGDMYTKSELLVILRTPVRGDAWVNLMQKVIAAKLSMIADPQPLLGTDPPYMHWDDADLFGGVSFSSQVVLANEWLVSHTSPVKSGDAGYAQGIAYASWIDYWLNYWDEGGPSA